MWSLTNASRLTANRTWVRDRDGSEVWLVAAKATFLIREDGALKLAPEPEPICLKPAYLGEPGASSLRYDTDLILRKTATDIIVHGHACAQQGSRVTSIKVGFCLGQVSKEVVVFGDRTWRATKLGIATTEPEPFDRMPIIWERAFGGYGDPDRKTWDVRNPVGTGYVGGLEHVSGTKLPNVENPASLVRGWGDRPVPAGFGPIDRHWTARARYAGTYDEQWEEKRKPLLPDDFDDRYHQCAPADQQATGFVRGGEEVRIWNMTPTGRLSFRLPRLAIGFKTYFSDGSSTDHRGELHTIVIEPSVPRLLMTWQSSLPCHTKILKLAETRVLPKNWMREQNGSLDDYEEFYLPKGDAGT